MDTKPAEKQSLRILFLASDPGDAARIHLGRELQEVRNKLASNPNFEIKDHLATKPDDVLQTIMGYKPHIVHFSGHGSEAGQICFEDEEGNSKTIPPDALASLFNLVSDYVKCVIVNTCYSESQARAIAQFVPVVIGTKNEITDMAAIRFSTGFYTSLEPDLTQGSLDKAFKLGCIAIQFDGNLQEHLKPVCIFGSPELRFTSEVESAFATVSNPQATVVKMLIRGLSLKGIAMGLDQDVVDGIIDSKIQKMEDYRVNLAEYETSFKEALRDEFPLSETTQTALSYLQNGLGLRQEDVAAVQKKILSDPKQDSAYNWYDRGVGQTNLGNYEKSLEYSTKAIEKKPEYSGAYYERGYVYDKLQKYEQAIEQFTKAIEYNMDWEVSSSLGAAYFSRGLAYYSMQPQSKENMTKALDDWSKSIEINPSEPKAYLNRGLAHQYLRNFEKAINDYKRSLEMDVKSTNKVKAGTVTNIIRCYSELGKPDEIAKWSERSQEMMKYPDQYTIPKETNGVVVS
jgi:tetratricopeptide (TPR) repeat protein